MNELLNWIKENVRVAIIGFALLFIIVTALGFFLGTMKRRSRIEDTFSPELEIEISSFTLSEDGKPELFIPEPVLPQVSDQFVDYSFYFDQNKAFIRNMELLPVRISELLKYRRIGIKSDIKPFQINNKEFDIIIQRDELAEP